MPLLLHLATLDMPSLLRAFACTVLFSWNALLLAVGLAGPLSSFCVQVNIMSPGSFKSPLFLIVLLAFPLFPNYLLPLNFFFTVLLRTKITLWICLLVYCVCPSTRISTYDIRDIVYILYSFSPVLGTSPSTSRLSGRVLAEHKGYETVCALGYAGVTSYSSQMTWITLADPWLRWSVLGTNRENDKPY